MEINVFVPVIKTWNLLRRFSQNSHRRNFYEQMFVKFYSGRMKNTENKGKYSVLTLRLLLRRTVIAFRNPSW